MQDWARDDSAMPHLVEHWRQQQIHAAQAASSFSLGFSNSLHLSGNAAFRLRQEIDAVFTAL
jgi:hypothetical protein